MMAVDTSGYRKEEPGNAPHDNTREKTPTI
jgi:hypothetical protein